MSIDVILREPNDNEPIGNQVLRQYVHSRLRDKRNVIIGLFGRGGTGKSLSGIKTGEIIEPETFDVDLQIVYTPLQYSQKIKIALHTHGSFYVLILDEAHLLVPAKLWYEFVVTAIAQISATFRQIKRLCVIIIAPSIKWIEKQMRGLLDLYGKVKRPLESKAIVELWSLYEDDTDVENIKIKKRRLTALVKGKFYVIKSLEFSLPKDENIKKYEELSTRYKLEVIENRLLKAIDSIEKVYGISKVDQLVDFYITHPEVLTTIVDKGNIRKEFKTIHDFSDKEFKQFKDSLNKKLAEKGLAYASQQSD